jgi:penicillin-binding protein 1A
MLSVEYFELFLFAWIIWRNAIVWSGKSWIQFGNGASSDGVTLGNFITKIELQLNTKIYLPVSCRCISFYRRRTFYEHSGIDINGTFRQQHNWVLMVVQVTIHNSVSIISWRRITFFTFRIIQKAKEWIIAIRLERQYTKNEIIALYFNQSWFCKGAGNLSGCKSIF